MKHLVMKASEAWERNFGVLSEGLQGNSEFSDKDLESNIGPNNSQSEKLTNRKRISCFVFKIMGITLGLSAFL